MAIPRLGTACAVPPLGWLDDCTESSAVNFLRSGAVSVVSVRPTINSLAPCGHLEPTALRLEGHAVLARVPFRAQVFHVDPVGVDPPGRDALQRSLGRDRRGSVR